MRVERKRSARTDYFCGWRLGEFVPDVIAAAAGAGLPVPLASSTPLKIAVLLGCSLSCAFLA